MPMLMSIMWRRRSFLAALGPMAVLGQMAPPKQAGITSSVMLWTLPGSFEEKLEIAARAGLQSVELMGEHSGWSDSRIADVRRLTRSLKLGMDAMSAMPDWGSKPVSMVDPAQRENLLKEVQTNIDYALKLEIPMLILASGNAIPGRPREEQYASLLEGAKRCGDLAATAGVTLIVEPLNDQVDHKGFYLTTCEEALRLVREVDNPHVRLLYDIYHEQAQTGDGVALIEEAVPYTKVFQVADHPGRHDPGTGEMDYATVYREIHDTGYEGYIAMEFRPAGEPVGALIKAIDAMRAGISETRV